MIPLPPLWLSSPSRFAGISKRHARIGLGVLVALILFSFAVLGVGPSQDGEGPAGMTDLILYDAIVEGVRHGGDYYVVTADALGAGGYPLRPFLTFRLPTLAVLQAAMPDWLAVTCLYLLAATVMVAWFARLRRVLPRPATRVIALILLAGGLVAFVQRDLMGFHEIWSAQFIALALALRRPGRWIEAAACTMIAMLFRETAVVLPLVMAACARVEGERREARGWAAVLGVYVLVLMVHAYAVAGVTNPLDPASPGWIGLFGFGLFVRAVTLATALQLFPVGVAAPLAALSLFGWAAWRDPTGLRVFGVLGGYAVAIMLFARLDTFYWGLMAAPLLLVGLVFVPDGVRDLRRAAMDRRRVRVQRISR